jgi:hypothetical protein
MPQPHRAFAGSAERDGTSWHIPSGADVLGESGPTDGPFDMARTRPLDQDASRFNGCVNTAAMQTVWASGTRSGSLGARAAADSTLIQERLARLLA